MTDFINVAGMGMRHDGYADQRARCLTGTEEGGKDMQSTSEQSTDQKFQNAADTECGATDLQQSADYETRNVPGTECGTRWRTGAEGRQAGVAEPVDTGRAERTGEEAEGPRGGRPN